MVKGETMVKWEYSFFLALALASASGCDVAEAGEVRGLAAAEAQADADVDDDAPLSAAQPGPQASSLATWEVDDDGWTQNIDGDGVRLNTNNLRYNTQTGQFDIPVSGNLDVKVNSAGDYIDLFTDTAKFVFHKAVGIAGRLELGAEDIYGKNRLLVNGAALIGTMQPYYDGQGNLTPDPLPTPYDYKLWVRGGPAFFNGLPPESGNGGNLWTTSVVVAANDGLTAPTDESPNREMRLLGSGPYPTGLYGAGISWGLAPQSGSNWRPGAWSSQQFLLGYWGGHLWLRGQEKTPAGDPASKEFADSALRDLVRFSADSNYHPLAVYGNVWAHGFIQASDERLKRDVKTLDGALATVLSLRGTSYQYASERKPELHLPAGKRFGFVAQEVQKVLPWLVSDDGSGTFAVSYDGFVPLLVEAVKEQNSELTAARAMSDAQGEDLAALRRELAEMRGQLAELKSTCAPPEALASKVAV
ncbi:MAG: tail fiber domain-containing protein, partial [Myxococcales bacterium]|nr:tail fiber domain-containing protein [Myxococcales bacterium]